MKHLPFAYAAAAMACMSGFAVAAPRPAPSAGATIQGRPERSSFGRRDRGAFNFAGHARDREDAFARESRDHAVQVRGYAPPHDRIWGGHWRYGFEGWHRYDHGTFAYGLYLFTPFDGPCYPSPWYFYPALPPYVPAESVTVVSGYHLDWNAGDTYVWPPRHDANDNPDLDRAIDDIQDAFRNHDPAAVEELIPFDGMIAIFQSGHYQYSVKGDDFREMVSDNVNNTQTREFRITSVRWEHGQAIVKARHDVYTPDDKRDTVYQTYRLRRDGDRFVITDFMTSR